MTGPQYVNDLSDVYTRMYNHPGNERPLNERFEPSDQTNREVEEDEDPNWKKLLRKHAKKQQRHMPPTIADVPRDDIPDAEENEEHQNVGVGSDFMDKYLDGLEARNQSASHQAQQYLETIIDNVPTAVGGVNIHSIIKDAFIAGTKAR